MIKMVGMTTLKTKTNVTVLFNCALCKGAIIGLNDIKKVD